MVPETRVAEKVLLQRGTREFLSDKSVLYDFGSGYKTVHLFRSSNYKICGMNFAEHKL